MKSLIQSCLRQIGYELRRVAHTGTAYETISPYAKYSPWNTDREFRKTYEAIRNNTLVDIFRCYQLWHLLGQTKHIDGAIVEVGVWRGGTGCLQAKRAQLLGIKNPVYLCDTFSGVVKAGSNDTQYFGGEHSDTSIPVVEALASSLGVSSQIKLLQGIFPEDTSHQIAEPAVRFCYIDVDVYQSTKEILEWIWPRLAVGGIVVSDDYGMEGTSGVTKCIDEFEVNAPGAASIYNLTGQAILVKTS